MKLSELRRLESAAEQQQSAAEINRRRSQKSWNKISRVLKSTFRRRTGIIPNQLILDSLIMNFLLRCRRPEALQPAEIARTVWQVAGDTIGDVMAVEMIRERERDAVQTWAEIRRRNGASIPLHARHRTEAEQSLWEQVCTISHDVADDPEREFYQWSKSAE